MDFISVQEKNMLIPSPGSLLKIQFTVGVETLSLDLHFLARDGQDVVHLLLQSPSQCPGMTKGKHQPWLVLLCLTNCEFNGPKRAFKNGAFESNSQFG